MDIDVSALTVAAGAFGTLSVAAVVSVLVSRVRDYLPTLSGRSAMAAVDIISLIVAALVLYQVGADWTAGSTYVALALGTLSIGIVARGVWAQQKGGA